MNLTPLCSPSKEDFLDLCHLLRACVEGGASIGFVLPIGDEELSGYWAKVGTELSGSGKVMIVARGDSGRIVGAVQLACETRANGRHRGEVQKLMVVPCMRRKGIAARLMTAVEETARERGLSLLYLDTSQGPGGAVAFYSRQGYTYVGGIPGYALGPDGTPAPNAIFYKTLAPAP